MFQSVRGMQDSLPDITIYWSQLEKILQELSQQYGYKEIRFPIVEKTKLFQHSIGSITDIVEKEMYHLSGNSSDSLSLRPEGTASCVRAAIQHRLLIKNTTQRLWYLGPMFRHERPQKGRYRQFHQFGVEAFGIKHPEIEVELIAMTQRLWKLLGINNQITLEINSLGSYDSRRLYREALVAYFERHIDQLDHDSKRRLPINPLRILDSKNPEMISINQKAPRLLDYLDQASIEHFSSLQHLLEQLHIPYTINPNLVRGLDYYNKTVFEWVVKEATGAQNTVCAGGRYDGLLKHLGGPDKPAIGFAIGLERLLDLWIPSSSQSLSFKAPYLYIIASGDAAVQASVILAEELRNSLFHCKIERDGIGGNFSNQFKRANEKNATVALVLGENEVRDRTITLKPLQTGESQFSLPRESLLDYLSATFKAVRTSK